MDLSSCLDVNVTGARPGHHVSGEGPPAPLREVGSDVITDNRIERQNGEREMKRGFYCHDDL